MSVVRGDAAKALAQRTIFSARRVLPEFKDVLSPVAVARCAHLLRSTLGEPSYVVIRPQSGPVEVWVVSLKNNNGVLSFELWQHADMPRYYIFADRSSPVLAKLLKRLRRHLYTPVVEVLSGK
ncbi:hypothetical protein [Dethiobacter alkaliphilus]|uniref:Uncharacterized protein n=1 Tax=Dethiobacter alkaliphilus AHT 1 TaxID=555088 RepID=C0GHE3_DETAL|nr:hypothetical protein [Dethiobacter alkaliphilus]EEG77149.1 hypothetical protein DealDRAFT_1902 [Dethiobacter alkaliphilus AHT 1]MCW3489871.1 hypothetical protein [Dethiobacter alkaliphilus]